MKSLLKTVTSIILATAVAMPVLSYANTVSSSTSTTSTMKSSQMNELVKVKMQYKDEEGQVKNTMAYVPKDKAEEMKKAKTVELFSDLCPIIACVGGPDSP